MTEKKTKPLYRRSLENYYESKLLQNGFLSNIYIFFNYIEE